MLLDNICNFARKHRMCQCSQLAWRPCFGTWIVGMEENNVRSVISCLIVGALVSKHVSETFAKANLNHNSVTHISLESTSKATHRILPSMTADVGLVKTVLPHIGSCVHSTTRKRRPATGPARPFGEKVS